VRAVGSGLGKPVEQRVDGGLDRRLQRRDPRGVNTWEINERMRP